MFMRQFSNKVSRPLPEHISLVQILTTVWAYFRWWINHSDNVCILCCDEFSSCSRLFNPPSVKLVMVHAIPCRRSLRNRHQQQRNADIRQSLLTTRHLCILQTCDRKVKDLIEYRYRLVVRHGDDRKLVTNYCNCLPRCAAHM